MAKTNPKVEATLREVTDIFIEQLESGDPGRWTKTWVPSRESTPHNPVSGAVYQGFNWMWLAMVAMARDFPTGRWATYKQWASKKAQVRKGEKGTMIIRVSTWISHDKVKCSRKDCETYQDRNERGCFFGKSVRGHYVFNDAQVDGADQVPVLDGFDASTIREDADDQDIMDLFGTTGADIVYAGDQPRYNYVVDTIYVPTPQEFRSRGAFATTVAHELVHWTGHRERLDRGKGNVFGSPEYALEELVAELGSVVTTSALGLETEAFTNHSAYLASWLKGLRGKQGPRTLLMVAGAASKAANYLVDKIEKGASNPRAMVTDKVAA